jgi:hypothetical protein
MLIHILVELAFAPRPDRLLLYFIALPTVPRSITDSLASYSKRKETIWRGA